MGSEKNKHVFLMDDSQIPTLFHLKKLTQDTCDVRQLCQEGYVRHKIGEEGGTHVTGDMSPGQGV